MKKKSKFIWGIFIVLLILLGFVLPFTILSDIHTWYGSFLLWGVIGVLIIIANIMVTRDWGE